jgi:hypothetical protein
MKVVFDSYRIDEEIPVLVYLKNRKLNKYFSRETAAAIVTAGKLLDGIDIDKKTPLYYATGIVEYEDYGLDKIVEVCSDKDERFSQHLFVEKGLSSISPLTQFKLLYNMTLCFISIEHNLIGDNAVLYSSACGLLTQALNAPTDSTILMGAGKVHKDGKVESGFSLILKEDIMNSPFLQSYVEAVEIFRYMSNARAPNG